MHPSSHVPQHVSQPTRTSPRGPTSEWDRLLRRLQADAAQVQAEVQWLREQSRRLLELEATRALTTDEAAQARAVTRQGQALRLRLQQLRAEFAQLQAARPQDDRRPPRPRSR